MTATAATTPTAAILSAELRPVEKSRSVQAELALQQQRPLSMVLGGAPTAASAATAAQTGGIGSPMLLSQPVGGAACLTGFFSLAPWKSLRYSLRLTYLLIWFRTEVGMILANFSG